MQVCRQNAAITLISCNFYKPISFGHVVSTSVLVGRGIVVVVVAAAAVFFPNGQFPWQIFRNDSDC